MLVVSQRTQKKKGRLRETAVVLSQSCYTNLEIQISHAFQPVLGIPVEK